MIRGANKLWLEWRAHEGRLFVTGDELEQGCTEVRGLGLSLK